jgi:outer membrane protein TolC
MNKSPFVWKGPFAWIAIFLGSLTFPAWADAQLALNVDTAVSRALDANPTLRAAALEHQRSTALVLGEEARYGFLLGFEGNLSLGNTPTLTLGQVATSYSEQISLATALSRSFEWGMNIELRAAATRQFRRAVFIPTMPTPIEVGPGYGLDVTLTVTQPLLRGFGDRVGLGPLRAARIDRDRTAAARDRAASELIRDAALAYWELWYAQQSIEVERHARDLAARQLEEARERQALGALPPADSLAFATRLASLEESLLAAESEARRRARELARLLGEAQPNQDLIETDATPPPIPAPRSSEVIDLVIEASPQIGELRAAIAAAEENARIAGQALEPRLDVQGQLAVHGLGYDDVGFALEQWVRFSAVTGLVGITYEMPLDDTQHRQELERARLAIEIAEQQLEAALQAIVTESRTSLDTHTIARRRLELADNTVTIARELLIAEQGRYELGARTSNSVLEAQAELRNAELRSLRARVDLISTELRLQHLAGELLDQVDYRD